MFTLDSWLLNNWVCCGTSLGISTPLLPSISSDAAHGDSFGRRTHGRDVELEVGGYFRRKLVGAAGIVIILLDTCGRNEGEKRAKHEARWTTLLANMTVMIVLRRERG